VKVTVNGEQMEIAGETSVLDLVKRVEPERWERGIAVALNGEVLPKAAWDTTVLSDSDRVEVLAAIGGG
jgi:sulfur carrier protein